MPLQINVKHDLKKLSRQVSLLQRQAIPKATVQSLNRTASSVKTFSSRHIASKMNSRQAAVKRRIQIYRASRKRLWSRLVARDRSLQLIEFAVGSKKPTQQKGGKRGLVKARVYGKVRKLDKAFIAPRKSGSSKTTIYIRKTNKRKPLRLLYGPNVMTLFKQEENKSLMSRTTRERFSQEFKRSLAFYISRNSRR